MPDVKISQLAAASAASVAAGAGLWTMAGHILGLRMEYVGPASIRVSSGSAWIPSLQRAVEVPAALTLSGMTLAANTWYHLYLYLNGATPAIEAVATAPASPYSGSARAKTGDASRRYVGSFLTDASSQILQFMVGSANDFRWTFSGSGGVLRPLANGKATTRTTVSLGAIVPLTATSVVIVPINTDSSLACSLTNPFASTFSLYAVTAVGSGAGPVITFQTDSSQNIQYSYPSAPASGLYIDVLGFTIAR